MKGPGKPRLLFETLLLLGVLLGAIPKPTWAVDCSTQRTGAGFSTASTMNLTSSNFTTAELQAAADYWSGCAGYGTEIPSFQIGGSGGIPITVTRVNGVSQSSTGGCGEATITSNAQNQVLRVSVTIWTQQTNGNSCEPISDSLAHELGHVLGLADALDPACNNFIMGRRVLTTRDPAGAGECAIADDVWEVPGESSPPDSFCDAFCWTSCISATCPTMPPTMEGCPLLLDIERNGIHLTGLSDAVWFDIDADGQSDRMSWTNRGEGLLALDHNGNGRIDDGRELFGDHTLLAVGLVARHGYEALAQWDLPALDGNGDGEISAADAVYPTLRTWSDLNHNGVSEAWELSTLAEAGITRIGLDYRRSQRRDVHGNELRFRGRAWRRNAAGREQQIQTWDVFFRVQP